MTINSDPQLTNCAFGVIGLSERKGATTSSDIVSLPLNGPTTANSPSFYTDAGSREQTLKGISTGRVVSDSGSFILVSLGEVRFPVPHDLEFV